MPSEDIGIDGTIIICDDSPLNGTEFRVQIKASKRFNNSEHLKIYKIKRSTLIYWLSGFTPTLLVAYDVSKDEGYYYWTNKLIAENNNPINDTRKEIILTIPKIYKIDSNCWDDIKNDLNELKISIINVFRDQSVLLPYLYELTQIIKRLNYSDTVRKIDGSPLTDDDLRFLWEMEFSCHRQFVITIEEILTNIKEGSPSELYIKNVITVYKEICNSFCVNFDEALYHWTKELQIGVKPKIMKNERHNLMGMMINLINSFLIPYQKKSFKK